MPIPGRTLYCSFCGKSQHEVKKLIAGPKVHICDACVGSCVEILGEDKEWCDLEIAQLRRLRRRARGSKPVAEREASRADRGWLGKLFR